VTTSAWRQRSHKPAGDLTFGDSITKQPDMLALAETPPCGESVEQLTGKDRLIVALDVPSVDEALRTVEQLDNVSFFKVGLQLFLTGGMPLLLQTLRNTRRLFVDLKVPGDIANTVAAVIDMCVENNVAFLTLSESMPLPAIAAAKAARAARHSEAPKLLIVPFLSSLDAGDLQAVPGGDQDLESYILAKARRAIEAGCDGVIASGQAIQVCRQAFVKPTLIVSPGIRPSGASTDDHKRHTTPAQAIRLGADYLVVGRPILKDPDPREAARRIIAEIDGALAGGTAPDAQSLKPDTSSARSTWA
jgi:orotidine-5'-phosphate decarboxylase